MPNWQSRTKNHPKNQQQEREKSLQAAPMQQSPALSIPWPAAPCQVSIVFKAAPLRKHLGRRSHADPRLGCTAPDGDFEVSKIKTSPESLSLFLLPTYPDVELFATSQHHVYPHATKLPAWGQRMDSETVSQPQLRVFPWCLHSSRTLTKTGILEL